MKRKIDIAQPSYWQRVFAASPINGGAYHGDKLSAQPWTWPENTYLARKNRQKLEEEKRQHDQVQGN